MANKHSIKKTISRIFSVSLAVVTGLLMYSCHKAKEETRKEIAAERQAEEARRKADPDFGPGGINRRISNEIAKKGVLSGFVVPDTNIDTLVLSGERRNQPAPMKGPRAGQTHPGQLGNTLIEDPKYVGDVEPTQLFIEGETPSNAPTRSANTSQRPVQIDYSRYRDSSGR